MNYLRRMALLCGVLCLCSNGLALAAEPVDYEKLPANRWSLINEEDNSGGKRFARAIMAESVDRVFLWGTGGAMPARNVYQRYELESFDPVQAAWQAAFPAVRAGSWKPADFPPFRILGQSGPDGLNYDEGPRLQTVGGYNQTNRVRFWDFAGVMRPSPIHTFNMACWDSRRERILYYSDGVTFALYPSTNSWTNLAAKNHPTACKSLAWASMCYDPESDRVLLFGGGQATNFAGAAYTWFYDCEENMWERVPLASEPLPRCNSPIVYDPATQCMVMFGGYDQSKALSDTWVFDCQRLAWEQRTTTGSPPPMFAPAATPIAAGKILVCGHDALQVRRDHGTETSAAKQTWVYDVKANTWTPIENELRLAGYDWLTATTDLQRNVALLVAFGPQRRTYALRYDASAEPADLPRTPSSRIAWKYPEQQASLEQAPPPDRERHAKLIESLAANTFVNANPPGMLISKTWSTAVIDTDTSQVLYTGGGHSGYSGNDFARYEIAANRWSLDQPPRFPPFLESTNAGIYGWSYGMVPFSQHTYLWYCYDPRSKTVLYLARPSINEGDELQLTVDPADGFFYEAEKHGYASWVYDPAKKQMHPPSFGRPFANDWHLCVTGTPQGVYCATRNRLYHAAIEPSTGKVDWRLVDDEFPRPAEEIKYHYEFQPLVHDTRRNRLIQLKGDANRVDVFARPLADDAAWSQLTTTGRAAIGREAVYIPKHDTLLWLGDKLHALDCGTNQMRTLDVELPAGLYGHECAMVYDPKLDLCVALIPQSFSGPMQTFLFRYQP